MARNYKLGPDVKPEEKVRDSKGNLIDENDIDSAVEDVHRQLGRGRPSLTAPGKGSPEIKARLPAELKLRVQQAARERGESLSDVVRDALERRLDQASDGSHHPATFAPTTVMPAVQRRRRTFCTPTETHI
jgi:hypothetical protein